VPLIQPPIMRALTTQKERQIKMVQLREVSTAEKIISLRNVVSDLRPIDILTGEIAMTEIIITMAVLAVIGGYIITSVLLLKFPLLLHKKKQIKFNPVHISHRGGMYCTSYFYTGFQTQ
jgi:hypothetical protein